MTRRLSLAVPTLGVALLLAATLPQGPAGATDPRRVRVSFTTVASGLSDPVAVIHSGDGTGRLFVNEQAGRVRVVPRTGGVQAAPYLDIRGRVNDGGEQGLLGIAFQPGFASHGYFFVTYTDAEGDLRISRFRASPPLAATVNPATEVIFLQVPHRTASNHNGGAIQFGKDGLLYITTGDGGGGGDPEGDAQSVRSLLGKVLRINARAPSPGRHYSIPSTNPYATSTTARREILHWGLRNPWRMTLDADYQTLWIADVGQGAREEVNWAQSNERNRNFGWDCREGRLNTVAQYGGAYCAGRTFVPPLLEYDHSNGRCAIIGGYVYRGSRYATTYGGTYVYADYCSGEVWGLAKHNGAWISALVANHGNITTFGEGPDRELYAADAGGRVMRLVPRRV